MAHAIRIEHHSDVESCEGGLDRAIAALARRQHGVVARAQLAALGAGRGAIALRLRRERLHPLHRGVYAVGHIVLRPEGHWLAAVMAGGPGAALSHRSAAALWGLRPDRRARTDVTAPAERRRPGIDFHRSPLPPEEVTSLRGIPVTTVARTLLDLAAVLDRRQLERAVDEAEVLRLFDGTALGALLARQPRRQGTRALRAALAAAAAGTAVTRSELEDRFLAFLAEAGMPRPETNVPLEASGRRMEADCVWRAARLVVELDGHATHATRASFERDRARDRALQTAGWRVVRITWRQLHDRPREIRSDLRELIGAGG